MNGPISKGAPGQAALGLLAVSLLLAGCAVRSSPPPELPPEALEPNRWAADSTDESGGPVPRGWLAAFGDPQLEALVEEALAQNQNLLAAAAQLEVARQLAVIAGADLYPFIGLSAGGARVGGFDDEPSSDRSSGALGASWEIDLWGGIRAGKAAVTADYVSATNEYEFAMLSLAAQTASSWFLAVTSKLLVELSEEAIDLSQRNLQIAQARFNAGLVSELDLHLARSQLAADEEGLRRNRSDLEQAVRSLQVLLGRYPDAELRLADQLAAVPPPIPVGIPAQILERRPDIVAAERQVASAFHQIQVAQAARLPSISLTGSANTAASGLRTALNLPDPFWNLGANLFAPLFAGGSLKANVEIANSQQQAALHGYVQAVLVAFSEVETALANETYFREAVGFQKVVVQEANDALRQARVQYDFGLIDFLSVIQIQEAVLAAKSRLLGLENQRLSNRINLYLSLGADYDGSGPKIAQAGPDTSEE